MQGLIKDFSTNGFIVDKRKCLFSKSIGKCIRIFLIKILFSSVEIKGKDKLERPNPLIIVSNHTSCFDVLFLSGLKENTRIMTAKEVMGWDFGLFGLVLGQLFGCFCAAPGDNQAAVRGAVQVLDEGSNLALCPESWVTWGRKDLPYKDGVLRIKKLARLKDVTPIKIVYSEYPPIWFENLPWRLQFLLSVFTKHFRSKVVIKVGDPLDFTNLAYLKLVIQNI